MPTTQDNVQKAHDLILADLPLKMRRDIAQTVNNSKNSVDPAGNIEHEKVVRTKDVAI